MLQRVLLIGLVFGGLIFVAMPVRATVSVDVSNNAAGSNNQVNINSNSQNTNSKTDVKVETNGEVKEFHTQGDEDVNYQSDDGSVKVNVNNSTSSSYQSETKTKVNNDVNVSVKDGSEDLDEVEEATDSPTLNNKVARDSVAINQEDISPIENILIKLAELNKAFKDQLRKLFG
jgi:hypothetical protein